MSSRLTWLQMGLLSLASMTVTSTAVWVTYRPSLAVIFSRYQSCCSRSNRSLTYTFHSPWIRARLNTPRWFPPGDNTHKNQTHWIEKKDERRHCEQTGTTIHSSTRWKRTRLPTQPHCRHAQWRSTLKCNQNLYHHNVSGTTPWHCKV